MMHTIHVLGDKLIKNSGGTFFQQQIGKSCQSSTLRIMATVGSVGTE